MQSAHFGFILSVKVIFFGFPNTEVNRTRLKNFDFIARMILIIFSCFVLLVVMFLSVIVFV